jgi:tRNA pseudouridine38-40 synthase
VPRTLKLTIAYDGTDFAGWQRQAGDRTVQAAVEDALSPIDRRDRVVIIGAGRTDAGVHAAAQVASATLEAAIGGDELRRALNATLPADVRVLAVDEAPAGFNAQFAATRKTYRYWVWGAGVVPPHLRRFVWHVPQVLDVERMAAAAKSLLGEHDFAGFQAAGSDVATTVRRMLRATVRSERPTPSSIVATPAMSGDLVCVEITGTGFLRHMVRNVVGTLIDIGRARRPPEDVDRIIAARDRRLASATAPAHGLTLWNVEY